MFVAAQPHLAPGLVFGHLPHRRDPCASHAGDKTDPVDRLSTDTHAVRCHRPAGRAASDPVPVGRCVATADAFGRHHDHLWAVRYGQVGAGHGCAVLSGCGVNDGCPPGCGVLFSDLGRLFDNHRELLGLGGQQRLQVPDLSLKFSLFLLELAALHCRQAAELHVQDGGGLNLGQLELAHQVAARGVHPPAAADGVDHLVDVIQGDQQPLDDVQACLAALQFVAAAAPNHLQAMQNELLQELLK